MAPTVSVVTSHGRQILSWQGEERVVDLLNRYQIPWSAVSIYATRHSGEKPVLCPCLDAVADDLGAFSELLLYFNRNINPFIFSLGEFKVAAANDTLSEATEYFYQKLDNEHSSAEVILKKLSPDECRTIIAERVRETIKQVIPVGSKLVVGVSGGGDSNAMLYGLSQIPEHELSVHPVIIKGIPDWDLGVPRARELCNTYGLNLTIIDEGEVRALLGISSDGVSLIERFEREFKGDDFEFMGTLLIRLALSKVARTIGTQFIATGLNVEDVLCENLFRITNGMKPAMVPARNIGETILAFPLWLCPKRIIDGCFPKLSLDNYDARYPCFSLGRNIYYSMIYTLQSQYPGFVERMARGLSELAEKDPIIHTFDEQLGVHVERFVPFPLRQKFLRMLSGSPVPS
ncbi:hypothetical protein [Mesorhizobium sp. LSHC414A00]|uniref:hypothetical protein n=1 Tax=Mesorhizobium sp. LSHC414A00 TaxID=1287287 RepID=UPI0003CE1659|nr:hypothetical protein [Mesorhizobium sp. LSHC414A00]ESX79998.1 hypothetical protein X757_03260 [Mesorhizobium sp. LSHC414A00]